MKNQTEIIVLVVVLVLIYTRPSALVRFSSTFIGKLILLAAVVLSSLVSPLSGFLIATLMVLYSEQNYEGFKEGNNAVSDPTFLIRGGAAINSTELIIRREDNIDVDVAPWNSGTYDIKSETIDDATAIILENNTRISEAYKGLMVHLKDSDYIPISVLPSDSITIDIYGIKTGDTENKIASGTFANNSDSTTTNISEFMISSDVLSYATGKGRDDTIVSGTGGWSGGYVKIVNATDDPDKSYEINFLDNVITVIFTSGITKPIIGGNPTDPIRKVNIVSHSHTHNHIDGFEGLENKSTEDEDQSEDKAEETDKAKETSKAINEIMGKLDMDGILDAVKKTQEEREGFFSGDMKNGSEVAGAFAGESYESEISGTSECNTTICERIHREEQLIRPVNSNEELQHF